MRENAVLRQELEVQKGFEGILGESDLDSFIHKLGNTAIRFGRLKTQGTMQQRIEVDSGSLLRGLTHRATLPK